MALPQRFSVVLRPMSRRYSGKMSKAEYDKIMARFYCERNNNCE